MTKSVKVIISKEKDQSSFIKYRVWFWVRRLTEYNFYPLIEEIRRDEKACCICYSFEEVLNVINLKLKKLTRERKKYL